MKQWVLFWGFCFPFILYGQQALTKLKPACAACHGQQGVSTNPLWPHLAGQHSSYLLKQLKDMQQGKQVISPIMTSVLAPLHEEDLRDLAVYYAKMPKPCNNKNKVENRLLNKLRGEQLYKTGDSSKGIMACVVCHGPTGEGNEEIGFPLLGGQHSAYIIRQLQAFKNKTRTNDLNGVMQRVSSAMSAQDRIAVAHYIEGLRSEKE